MENLILELNVRDKDMKVNDLRKNNLIPIEYYGKGVKNLSLQSDYQNFRKLYRVAGGNTVIQLKVDGKNQGNVLIHDVVFDPVTDRIVHVDLISVKGDQVITTSIPLEFVEIAPAVKELGGILTYNLDEIEVKCLPGDLVKNIEVDMSSLVDFNIFIRVKDLKIPGNIEVLNDMEDLVVTVVPPRTEEEEEPDEVEGEELEDESSGDGKDEKSGEKEGDEEKSDQKQE